MLSALLMAAALASPPAEDDGRAALEARVAALEARVTQLEAQLAAEPTPPPAHRASAAAELLKQAEDAHYGGDPETARRLLDQLQQDHAGSPSDWGARRLAALVDTVGTPLPEDWKSHVLEWYTKPGRLHLDRGVVVVLFWETWCPHCKREIPKWESTARRYAEQGLTVVGLTRLTRSATRETATRFVEEHHLGFPLGQEDGSFASAAEVSGIPAAAVYRDGLLIWRGHPARITDALLTGWLEPQ